MPSPADELRAAASRIRERAEKATPGPWEVGGGHDGNPERHVPGRQAVRHMTSERSWTTVASGVPEEDDFDAEHYLTTEDAEHIAVWSPPPALAVAALLDLSAAQYEEAEAAHWQVEYHLTEQAVDAALVVARTIPGGGTP